MLRIFAPSRQDQQESKASASDEGRRRRALEPVVAARFPGMQSSIVGDAPFLRNKVSHD